MSDTTQILNSIMNNLSPDINVDLSTDKDTSLEDLGVDSLDNMSLFLEVQEKFNLQEIPDSVIDGLTTPAQIIQYIHEQNKDAA